MSTQLERQDQKTIGSRVERARTRAVLTPAVDIYETRDELVLTADMPGVDESAVDVTLEQDVLTIGGRMPELATQERVSGLEEFHVGDYRRVFTLATEVDRDRISAQVKNGVLRLTLPKSEPAKARKIKVQAG